MLIILELNVPISYMENLTMCSNFLQMSSFSNLELLNSFQGQEFNNTNADHHQPIFYDSIGPNGPMLNPTMMAHFTTSGHVGNGVNRVQSAHFEAACVESDLHKVHKNCGKKRKRGVEREGEEVVHIRAKRGQATDSHSLAERVRRAKINEKLKCLQELVPGCYETMGMAMMLDVVSDYVRSLQNQINFLSMKLSAASLVYDFNSSEAEATEALQGSVYDSEFHTAAAAAAAWPEYF